MVAVECGVTPDVVMNRMFTILLFIKSTITQSQVLQDKLNTFCAYNP